MSSVWKRLQRSGKKASKFHFAASFQELVIECTNKWQPDKLRVVWTRRNRRFCSKLHGWQPGIQNPYRGMVIWQVPENVDITVTLFKDPGADEFEDKDWTFIIENETKGRRKVLASVDVNMKKYASATPSQVDLTLKLKSLSVKVVEATLKLSLSCIFLKEGKATDEDMQSLASLMSLKQSDIGNLDDFNDSDEEEDKRVCTGSRLATSATEIQRQLSTLIEEDYPSSTVESMQESVPHVCISRPEDFRISHRHACSISITNANQRPAPATEIPPLLKLLPTFEPRSNERRQEARPDLGFEAMIPTAGPQGVADPSGSVPLLLAEERKEIHLDTTTRIPEVPQRPCTPQPHVFEPEIELSPALESPAHGELPLLLERKTTPDKEAICKGHELLNLQLTNEAVPLTKNPLWEASGEKVEKEELKPGIGSEVMKVEKVAVVRQVEMYNDIVKTAGEYMERG
ncbi:hypothetical protein AAFF_G00318490 [Aldrovandia affinis]|uniref:C2 NT-type domain-containing protein n=1 Tax=Aldrovandia affinis TaxID=143900 RepID=A0AAD7SMK9_9TELE|nr:hypothetical protein AAFF_G00318490 [Aldrovandia affinis]